MFKHNNHTIIKANREIQCNVFYLIWHLARAGLEPRGELWSTIGVGPGVGAVANGMVATVILHVHVHLILLYCFSLFHCSS